MITGLSTPIAKCRSCGSSQLETVLDLGRQPPANSLRASLSESVPTFPLVICRCADCATVQLTETVDPRYLFQQYVWVTGTSSTATAYSARFCDAVRTRSPSGRPLFVVEVASNDGTFLKRFQAAGDRVLGVDPAQNIAAAANAAGVPTWAEFFTREIGERIRREQGPADVAFARNVLPHVPDPLGILRGMAACVGDDGLVVVEFHQADAILDELHYDSIYHEHLFYHSLRSMEYLLNQAGLQAFDLMESPISGGSLVAFCAKTARPASESLQTRRQSEEQRGTNQRERWQQFAASCFAHRQTLVAMVDEALRSDNGTARMIGYGASARSSTLLNFCGIGQRQLRAIADRNPLKHHHWTAGTDVEILPPDEAFARIDPNWVLLLAWNFRDEILQELQARGYRGRVIVPLPKPEVISL